jgi:3-deoxy-D-arabino-heptulosonate 7-phosphate (DAHP) synthase
MVECDFDFCVVRVRHNSKVDIKAINNARMRVFIYDKGEVNIVEKDDTSRISVIQRGGKLNTNGYNVKLITPKTTY